LINQASTKTSGNVRVGFIRPELVCSGRWDIREENPSSLKILSGLMNQAPTKTNGNVGVGFIRPEVVSIGRWDIREEVSLLPKDTFGLDKSSPYKNERGLINQAPTNSMRMEGKKYN